ncbi:MAG: glycosyltransferase family 2 protein [Cyanobacteria bacterium SIG31]|nr:glycosyltransferase family 2 protein [Cyanobacteria bacterium SIG31]
MASSFLKSTYTQDLFDVSIIMVNWNAGKYLEDTINSLREKTQDILFEIILIDNNSDKNEESYFFIDKLLEQNNVTVIKSEENLGFAKANNIGMEIAKGRNFLILNPDVVFHNNVIKILSDYLDNNEAVGMVGPKVLNPNGSFQQPCLRGKPYPKDTLFHLIGLAKAFPKCEALNGYALWHLNRDEINECGALSGCCMMLKKSLFEEIGGMDEQFFMYQEETDWGLRTAKAGKKTVYNPNAIVTHVGGVTTRAVQVKTIWIFTQSMMKFFKKHFWNDYNFVQKAFWTTLIYGNFVLKYVKAKVKR